MEEYQWQPVKEAVWSFFNENLERMILSNPLRPQELSKVKIRPVLMKEGLCFQAEEQRGAKAFHRNLSQEEGTDYVLGLLKKSFRQCELASSAQTGMILVS